MKVEAVRDGKRSPAPPPPRTAPSTSRACRRRLVHREAARGRTSPRPTRACPGSGPALVTPAIIGAYLWIWTGFAMVLIGAGLAALPRDALEAARMDGANEWQIFRRITVPLLAPVLTVVFVTLVINVMKVFDLVYIIAPGPVQEDANVLATQMWLVSFGGGNNQGLGSALGVLPAAPGRPRHDLQHPPLPKERTMTHSTAEADAACRHAGPGCRLPGGPPSRRPARPARQRRGPGRAGAGRPWSGSLRPLGLFLVLAALRAGQRGERLVDGARPARAAVLRQLHRPAGQPRHHAVLLEHRPDLGADHRPGGRASPRWPDTPSPGWSSPAGTRSSWWWSACWWCRSRSALLPVAKLFGAAGHVRHDPGRGPLPRRLRAAVRDLPAA